MRLKDIKIGETYIHTSNPSIGFAKVIKIIKPKPMYQCHTEKEKSEHVMFKNMGVILECEWTLGKNDKVGMIKYFKPRDLFKGSV